MQLKELVHIRTGSPELSEKHGDAVKVVRMKSMNHDLGAIDWDQTETASEGSHLVKTLVKDEILIIAKGERNTAALINDIGFKAIASNHFFILSLTILGIRLIDPRYLTWYLNHPAKKYFSANSTGAVIPNLRKETLGNLQILIPNMSEQMWIAGVYERMVKQKEIFTELFKDRVDLLVNYASNLKEIL